MRRDLVTALSILFVLAAGVTAVSVALDVPGFSGPDGRLAWPRIIVTWAAAFLGIGGAVRNLVACLPEVTRLREARDAAHESTAPSRGPNPPAHERADVRHVLLDEDAKSLSDDELCRELARAERRLELLRRRMREYVTRVDVPLYIEEAADEAADRVRVLEDELRRHAGQR